jgi:uncharacterized protein (TIGR02646 family)
VELLHRPSIKEVEILKPFEQIMLDKCAQEAKWQSSGKLYEAIKSALNKISKNHCNFCDGYPLNETSKQTVEHYFPKADFSQKVYDWANLFFCCDKCQSSANSVAFIKSLKPDEPNFIFEKLFYFEPQDGEIKVLKQTDNNLESLAAKFLERYGINKFPERKINRKRAYDQQIHNLKTDYNIVRDENPYRFILDTAIKAFNAVHK